MIAVIDETTPEVDGAILYTVVSAVVIADVAEARLALANVLPDRKRPFHWNQEGPTARAAMVDCLEDIGVVGRAHVVQCGRRSQERARRVSMDATIGALLFDGCSEVLIETRDEASDGRDRAAILDLLRRAGRSGELRYDWVDKSEPLVWIADAIGGAVREHLTGAEPEWYEPMTAAASVTIEWGRIG